MTDLSLLQSLGTILVAAAVCVLLARAARIPSILAYIIAGLILGPLTGLIAVTDGLDLISEMGIALLLFLVGLELSFDKIRDISRVALVAGLGQVLFTAAGGFGLGLLLGFDPLAAIFIATALTFSSTVVVVKLLDQKKELNALYGRIAVGIFLVQDLVVILILTFLAGLGRQGATDGASLAANLGIAFGGMLVLLVTALLSARYLLPRLFGWISSWSEALLIWALCWCFLFVLGAEALRLSLEIGAFLAGISLAQLPYTQELRRRVHPLMNFFIAVFFVTLGIRLELGAAIHQAPAAAILSLFVLIGNPVIFMWLIARMGYGERTSFLASVTVAQISEFSFIFATLGVSTGLIGDDILSLIAIVGLITIGLSAYMILYNHQLYRALRRRRLLRWFRARSEEAADTTAGMRDHVIVAGMNALGRRIVHELAARGESVLAVDTDPEKLKGLPGQTMRGNVSYSSVLEEACMREAKLVVSALQIQDTNNLLAYRCRGVGVPVSIHAFDPAALRELRELGPSHLIRSKNAGVQQIAAALQDLKVLER